MCNTWCCMKLNILNRKIHYWSAIIIAVPLLIVIATGIILQLKKDWTWVQPASQRGTGKIPTIAFDDILRAARTVPEAAIETWDDIDRMDVRPGRGIVKVQSKNSWEIQIDTANAKVLQVEFRRSDIIEAMHDGSWFFEAAKLWIFLPSACLLLVLWCTGMYLFFLPIWVKSRRKREKQRKQLQSPEAH